MPDVHLIAAVGRRGQLGLDGKMPWHDPMDLQWFKALTMGHIVIVGWKTANMMPDLPGRYVVIDNVEMTPEDVLGLAEWKDKIVFIAGGERTYRRYMHLVQRAHISRIDYDGPADAWMPPLWAGDVAEIYNQAIAQARENGRLKAIVVTERERCRKIAEDVMLEAARATPNEMNSVIEATARTIAASIRLDP